MRRPLFVVCLCLVAAIAVWLQSQPPPDLQAAAREAAGQEIKDGDCLTVTGQVYRKETRTSYGREIYLVYLNSIIIQEINNSPLKYSSYINDFSAV